MQEVNLSKVNQAYINNTVNKTADNQTQVQQAEPKKDGNKKMKLALIGLGVIGAAAIGVGVAIKTGKIKLPNKTSPSNADDLKNGLEEIKDKITTKFSDLKGNAVDVTFPDKNGIAKTKDGLFSGTLEKAIKKEDGTTQNILVSYIDGKPTETKIDGVTRKTFNYLSDNTTNTLIYDDKGAFKKQIRLFSSKDNANKIDRVYTKTKNDYGKYLDFEAGKIKAKTILGSGGVDFSEVYDSEGNVIKTIRKSKYNNNSGMVDMIIPTKDGQKILTGGLDSITDKADDFRICEPESVHYLDKDGKLIKDLSVSNGGNTKKIYRLIDADNNELSMALERRSPIDKKPSIRIDEFKNNGNNNNSIVFSRGQIKQEIENGQKADFIQKIKNFISELGQEGIKLNIPEEEIQAVIDKI